MSRLIDADILVKEIKDTFDGYMKEDNQLTPQEVVWKLEEQPTVSAIPLDKVKAVIEQLNEEKEYAYADFDEYKQSVLGIETDELPEDEYRYGIERCLHLLKKLIAESEG